jgi:translocation and assembly module TamB
MRGGGRVARPAQESRWRFDDVDLRLGRARLQLDGTLATGERDLDFVIDAEDLSLLDPEARGRINARGRIAGNDKAPLLKLTARGTDFEWQGIKLDALAADVDLNLGPGGKTEADVQLRGLLAGGRAFPSTRLTVAGTSESQRIGLDINTAQVRTNLEAAGGFSGGNWNGEIRTLRVSNDRDLNLHLERPAPLTFSKDSVQVQQLCLVGETARSCASGQRDPEAWSVDLASQRLPLVALTAGLTSDVQYFGTINLDAHAEGGAGRKATGELHADLDDAELRHQLSNKRVETLALGNGRVDALAVPENLSISMGLDAGPSGNIRGNLTALRNTEDWKGHPIKGELDLTTDGLGVLDVYLGGIDRATGRLTTRVTVDGTLGEPRFEGLLQLRNAEIDIFRVNMMLRDLSMDAHFNARGLDLEGHSALGGGTVNFGGNLAWRNREPYGELRIQGENLLVADVPEARIEASPDLLFKVTGRRIDTSGKVLLPTVRLEPADLTNAALASGDEVIIGGPQVDPANRWTVVNDIRVELGDKVSLDAYGLSARLGGALNVRTDEYGVTRGQGELGVVEGSYQAFGRKLDVARGKLIYNNVPLGDPGIDLRAQKEFENVTAGVNVRGTLRAPRMSFYSEPTLPQSQIASVLLAGGNIDSAQNSRSQRAASSMLLAQGGAILAQKYGSQVGIQDVALETDLSNDTSLVLGRYLSPKLYVSYGISLAEAINTLKLRYTLGDHWTVKIESGSAQSADIEYTIRR